MTFEKFSYSLYCLRRRIALSIALPAFTLVVMVFGFGLPPNSPVSVFVLVALWSGIVIAHSLFFPHAWFEIVALMLVAMVFASLGPITIPWLLTVAPDRDRAMLGLAIGGFIAAIGLFAFFIFLISLLEKAKPIPEYSLYYRRRVPMQLAELKKALCLSPSTVEPDRICGPQDSNGFFEVEFKIQMISQVDFEPEKQSLKYKAKIVEESEISQATMIVGTGLDNVVFTSMIVEHFFPDADGCIYEVKEVNDFFNHWLAFTFWVNDSQADFVTSKLDLVNGRPSRALRERPQTSFIFVLARYLRQSDTEGF